MAKDQQPVENLSAMAEQAFKETMEQTTRGVVDCYFDFLKKTMDLGEKLKNYADRNIAAAHDYVQKLSQAKNFQEIILIQTEFMQTQMNAFGEQAKSFSEGYTRAAADGINTPLKKSLD